MSRKNLLISRNNVEDITWKFGVFFPVPDDFQAVRSIGQVNQISDYLETVRPSSVVKRTDSDRFSGLRTSTASIPRSQFMRRA